MLTLFPPVLVLAAVLGAGDSLSTQRMEQFLAQGDDDIAVAALRRNIEDALPFFDQYLEGGLKVIENGGDEKEAMRLFRLGVRFAKLADQAAPGASFAEYASNFASWSPQERQSFRRGQAEYQAGRKSAKSDPAQAAEHFRTAAATATSLGDLWGQSMAYSALTQAELDAGHFDKVDDAARMANDLNPKLRQRLATIHVLVAWGDAQAHQSNRRGPAAPSYQYAWSQLRDDDPDELRKMVGARFAASLDQSGQSDIAAQIRIKVGLAAAEPTPNGP